jgi:hypothetical protein
MSKEGIIPFKIKMAERSDSTLRHSTFLVRYSAVPEGPIFDIQPPTAPQIQLNAINPTAAIAAII